MLGREEIHTAEPIVPEPNALEFALAVEELKSYKSQGTDQIPAEFIKAGSRIIRYEIRTLIISIWNKEELPEEWKESIIVPICKRSDKTDCSNCRGTSVLPPTYRILSNILLSRLTPYTEEIIWIINVDFDVTGQLLIIHSEFIKYLRKKWEYNEAVHQHFIDFKKACHSVRRGPCIIFSLSLLSSWYW